MTPTPTIETAVRVLNEAFVADPVAIHALQCVRIPCSNALADHPTVIVDNARHAGRPEQSTVGLLGLLNGVLEAMTGKRVATQWEMPEDGSAGRMIGFRVYDPASGKVETGTQ